MDYNSLKIKDKFIGKTLFDNHKSYILSNDLTEKDKRYIYNMITKQIFDMYDEPVEILISAPVTEKEIKIIEVKIKDCPQVDKEEKPKVTRKPRTKKVKAQ